MENKSYMRDETDQIYSISDCHICRLLENEILICDHTEHCYEGEFIFGSFQESLKVNSQHNKVWASNRLSSWKMSISALKPSSSTSALRSLRGQISHWRTDLLCDQRTSRENPENKLQLTSSVFYLLQHVLREVFLFIHGQDGVTDLLVCHF